MIWMPCLMTVAGSVIEVVDGELCVTRAPYIRHQGVGGKLYLQLENWSEQAGLGSTVMTPGVIFTEMDAVCCLQER